MNKKSMQKNAQSHWTFKYNNTPQEISYHCDFINDISYKKNHMKNKMCYAR